MHGPHLQRSLFHLLRYNYSMRTAKRTLYIVIAVLFIVVGICGLVLPILNGIIFLLLGFILLSFESTYIHHHLQRLAAKNDHLNTWYKKLDTWMRKIFV